MDIEKEKKVISIIDSIDSAIDQYIAENRIDDISMVSMSIWNSILIYINNIVFGNRILLKSSNKRLNGLKIYTNYNSYDYELLEYICDYYIYLCYKYQKEVSQSGFSKLTGVSLDTIIAIGGERATSASCEIRKKLLRENEETLSNKLFDAKGNPVGIIAILNHRHAWATQAAAHGIEKRAKTAAELPDLSAPGGQKPPAITKSIQADEKPTE